MKILVTPLQLRLVCSNITLARAGRLAGFINEMAPRYGMDNGDELHEFLATVAHECNEFNRMAENLNYSTEALLKNFGRHRISEADAYRYGRRDGVQVANQQAIANILYGGQWGNKHLGNNQPNDGWNFRGAGFIQTTGRSNVTSFTDYINKRDGAQLTPQAMAILMRTDDRMAMESALWIFCIEKSLLDEAVRDEMLAITKAVNGGVIGLKERLVYYEAAKRAISA